ncbi:PrpF protein [Trichoderma sp. SZMC 28015]
MRRLPAWFVRSGTSTGLLFSRASLPPVPCQWQPILAPAMGSPDPLYARQLDGMGSGISSTSKVVVVGPPSSSSSSLSSASAGAASGSGSDVGPGVVDAEFTFVQVGIRDGTLDLAGTCGNMSAIVGPAAWDMGFVPPSQIASRISYDAATRSRWATLRILNTNTNKIVVSRFQLDGSPLAYSPHGDYAMDGVPGTQSPITLSFLDPAGAKTGRALPTGNPIDELHLPDGSRIKASLVDVSNPGVFITTSSLGIDDATAATLTPSLVEANPSLKARLEQIRQAGASAMRLDPKIESVPKVVMLLPSTAKKSAETDIQCLAMSMGQAHKAAPLTLSLCLGAASQIAGTIAAEMMGGEKKSVVRIGHPSGVVDVGTTVRDGKIEEAKLLRTARVLMKGDVYY